MSTKERATGSKSTLQFIPDWAEFGSASPAALVELAERAPFVKEGAKEGVTFPGATFLQVIYEIDMFDSARFLPPSLAPVRGSSFVVFRAYRLPDTPWGPTSFAEAGTVCRFGYRPRVFQISAKTDNPAAAEALRDGWGFPLSVTDTIDVRRYHDGTYLRVADGGRTTLAVQTTRPILTAGGSLGINSSLHFVNTPQGSRVFQIAEDFTFQASEVGRPEVRAFDAEAWDLTGVHARYPVSAVSAVADITLRPIQWVSDTDEPALLNIRSVEES